MGRPKEFNRDEVLDRAVEIFRCDGYKGTSMQQLLEGMGINRSSLYDAFGDKHQLFLEALDRYETRRRDQLSALFRQAGPRKPLIREYFESVIDDAINPPITGCLLMSSAVELASQNPDVAERLYENFVRMESIFFDALVEAREKGEMSPFGDLRKIARFLVGTLRGIRLTAKVAPKREVLLDILTVALSVLDQTA